MTPHRDERAGGKLKIITHLPAAHRVPERHRTAHSGRDALRRRVSTENGRNDRDNITDSDFSARSHISHKFSAHFSDPASVAFHVMVVNPASFWNICNRAADFVSILYDRRVRPVIDNCHLMGEIDIVEQHNFPRGGFYGVSLPGTFKDNRNRIVRMYLQALAPHLIPPFSMTLSRS
jgi:hypothetical protein